MPGRKRTGEFRNCEGCGKEIYVRAHRLRDERRGKYCQSCFCKNILPRAADGKRGVRTSRNVVSDKGVTREEFFHDLKKVSRNKPILMKCMRCEEQTGYEEGDRISCQSCGCQYAVRVA